MLLFECQESYETQKHVLKSILKLNEIRVTPSTTYEQFVGLLESAEESKQISEVSVNFILSLSTSTIANLLCFSSDKCSIVLRQSQISSYSS